MEWVANALRHHPELALFLALAVGYAIGKIKIGGFKIGPVIGVLIAGVVIGQLGIKVSNELKYAFFLLFLFAIGYKTGPQFFRGLRASGLPQAGTHDFDVRDRSCNRISRCHERSASMRGPRAA